MQYRISHAQNFEDVMLWRALKGVAGGRYIDIGAQSPDIDSVGRLFFEEGWHGVHVDANADYAAQLRAARPDDLVVEAAVTDYDGMLRFYEIPGTGLSTAQEDVARAHADGGFPVREREVEAITLDVLFARAGEGDVHWLKIDVEGGETDVLRGWRTSPVRPWIVVVESTRPLSQLQSHADWEPMLLAKGYRFAWFDGLNRFYVSDAHQELAEAFVVPPNLFDDFALSGKASSPFCRIVARERDDALALAAHERQVVEDTRADVERARAEGEALLAAASAAAAAELERTRREATDAMEAALASERQAGAAAMEAALASERQAGAAALDAQAREAAAQLSTVRAAAMDREHGLLTELQNARGESRRLQEEADILHGRLQESQLESHRWWIEAETLRAERREMLNSHSWRLTAPLRAARRLLSDPRKYARVYARIVLAGSMRVVVDSPLREMARAVLARAPALRSRMRAIAVAHQVIPGVEPALPAPEPPRPHAPPDPRLGAGARRVHARLRELLREHK